MSENEYFPLITLAIGKKYPLPYPEGTGAATQFLVKGGGYLQVMLPNMKQHESEAIRTGKIKAGLLYKEGAMLFLFQFHDKNDKPIFSFDSVFDVRLIDKEYLDLPDIENPEQRIAISIHGIDNSILRALRYVTLPPGLTLRFLSFVQDQMATTRKGEEAMSAWMKIDIDELIKHTETWMLGP